MYACACVGYVCVCVIVCVCVWLCQNSMHINTHCLVIVICTHTHTPVRTACTLKHTFSCQADKKIPCLVKVACTFKHTHTYTQTQTLHTHTHIDGRREKAEAEAWSNRVAMLRSLSRQLLEAIDFIHSADTVHGSLSSGCVFLNTSSGGQPLFFK